MRRKYSPTQLKRREFLNVLAKSGIAAGALNSFNLGAGLLSSRMAHAQGTQKRALLLYVSGGAPTGHWYPTENLSGFQDCSKPFAKVKDECHFFKTDIFKYEAVDGGHSGQGRAFGAFRKNTSFTYAGGERTIDFELEDVLSASAPVSSLRMGCGSGGQNNVSTIGGKDQSLFKDNPKVIFEKAFGGDLGGSGGGVPAGKQSIIDANLDAVRAIQKRLGTYEKERFESHLNAILRIEKKMQEASMRTIPEECKEKSFNEGLADAMEEIEIQTQLHTETLIQAFKCGVTNVGSMMFGNHQGGFTLAYESGGNIVRPNYHQEVQHNAKARFIYFRTFLARLVANIVERLKQETDFDGTPLLDSTVILQTSCMGDGAGHSGSNAPMMLMGGGSSLKKGMLTSCEKHFQVLETMRHALGVVGQVPEMSADGPVAAALV